MISPQSNCLITGCSLSTPLLKLNTESRRFNS